MTAGERAAERLLARKEELALWLTEALYADMPHLLEKYGERGRMRCHEDMRFNIEHLAPAVALEQPPMFAAYVRWLHDLLRARNVGREDIVRTLELMTDMTTRLPDDEAAVARECIAAGMREMEAV